jgi:alpha-beta hydrolase superfamily lysophospholipase
MLISLFCIVLVGAAVLAGMIALGTSEPPPYLASIGEPFRHVDFSDLPQPQTTPARDGAAITFRVWPAAQPGDPERVVIAIHGSSAHGSSMHPLSRALRAEGITVYAPDIRGHGGTGRRGDIDYAAQLDDDAADFVAMVRAKHPKAQLVLMGFSSGGGYALHLAGSPLGKAFARAVLISPFLGPRAPTVRPDAGGWAKPFLPRIIALVIIGKLGIHAFDHLPALAFAIAPGNPGGLTGVYSFLLMQAFGTSDYAADLRNAGSPVAVLVGGSDELFLAEQFAATIHAVRPEVPVVVVPELSHIPMITDPRAVPAIVAAIRG